MYGNLRFWLTYSSRLVLFGGEKWDVCRCLEEDGIVSQTWKLVMKPMPGQSELSSSAASEPLILLSIRIIDRLARLATRAQSAMVVIRTPQ